MAPISAGAVPARALLEAKELTTRSARGELTLDAFSMELHRGKAYGLLGPAGSGAATVLRTFLGFIRPSSGRVSVVDIDPAVSPVAARRHVTYVPREGSLYPELSARQNVEFFTRLDGVSRSYARTDYYHAMRWLGVPERRFEAPSRTLDPATIRLLWLAVARLRGSAVIILDEPSAGLDPHAFAMMADTLVALCQDGVGVLMATSDVLLASHLADDVAILNEGRTTVQLRREEIERRSLSDIYREYLGVSRASHQATIAGRP